MGKKSSMRDVAKLANVSVATVSHVINGTKVVSADTRRQVEEAMKTLGYQTNRVPLPISPDRKTKVIGVIIPDVAHSLLISFFRALDSGLRQKGYEVLLASSREDLEQEKRHIRLFTEGIVDGILISSTATHYTVIKHLFPENFPVVFFDRIPIGCPYDSITINNYDAFFKGIEHLIYRNHSKIGCITSELQFSSKNQRVTAYRDVLRKYGLKEYYGYHLSFDAQDVYIGVKKLLNQGCTAIVSFNGRITEGIVNTLLKLGKKIGKDIDILICQDSTENEIYSLLSSVYIAQPVNELARIATDQIIERIDEPLLPIRQTVLMAYLVSGNQPQIF